MKARTSVLDDFGFYDKRQVYIYLYILITLHITTHTTKAERRSQELPRRQRRQRVAIRPKVTSKEIFFYFSDFGPRLIRLQTWKFLVDFSVLDVVRFYD